MIKICNELMAKSPGKRASRRFGRRIYNMRRPTFKRRRAFKNQLSTWIAVAPDAAASDSLVNRFGYGPSGSFTWRRNQFFKTKEAVRGSFFRTLSCAELRWDNSIMKRSASELVCGHSKTSRPSSPEADVSSSLPEWTARRVRYESVAFSVSLDE